MKHFSIPARRLWALVLALVMLLALAACGKTAQSEPTEASEPPAPETQAAPAEPETEPPTDPTEPAYTSDVEEGQVFEFTKLVGDQNGANGLTFYSTTDGTDLKAFEDYDATEKKWYRGDKGVLVYPNMVPADNYGVAGSSAAEYVVMGYELPATGTIDLYSWMALQGESGTHAYRVKVALGAVNNILCQYDVTGEPQTAAANTFRLAVEEGQTLYMIYEPLLRKDNEWFGYITSVTYAEVGTCSVLVEETIQEEVQAGDTFNFTSLSTNKNGANGLTYYFTADGKTVTPILSRDDKEDKWWHGGNGVLVYPRMDLVENYAVAGTSATDYVAMGFVLPATGTVDLYSWIALQGTDTHHGYIVKVALGTPDNVVQEYACAGGPQTPNERTFTLDVEAGQELFMIYEPTVWANGEWFGYTTSITYTDVR